MEEQNKYERELDNYGRSSMDRLKMVAFDYLLSNPGSEFGDWQIGLIQEYPRVVVDALGNNPPEVFAFLADFWEELYLDPDTDVVQSYSDWALSFATERAVHIYYRLASTYKKLKVLR